MTTLNFAASAVGGDTTAWLNLSITNTGGGQMGKWRLPATQTSFRAGVDNGALLPPGDYSATLTPINDEGVAGPSAQLDFTVVAPVQAAPLVPSIGSIS